jgi:hypothetical protein
LEDGVGLNQRAALYAHVGAGSWSSLLLRVRWYDATNTDLGASTGTSYPVPSGSWLQMTTDAVAPANATQGAVEFAATASATSSVLHVDAVALWQVLPLTSVEAVDSGGYITLTLRELTLDYELSVYRELADGSRQLVRGPSGLIDHQAITSDLLVVEDHEAPLNTAVRYIIEQWPPGSLSSTTRTSDYVTLNLANVNECWLKDPGNPQRNMRVVVQQAPEWSRPIEQAVHRVRGRRNAVVLSGVRGGLEGDLAIWTRTAEERRALHLLLDSGNVLLWQAAPGMAVDDM